eukprot:TRINITY_DN9123_c0_g1_i1.p2 TRINITY_DN9123_c0_g1~~TRINITY_DN9123_c0_g1_i1.p2  ORF type:complete len:207 (-),score=-14.37 TRINITY_DN9123_c0_g1_i1:481-1101(-)
MVYYIFNTYLYFINIYFKDQEWGGFTSFELYYLSVFNYTLLLGIWFFGLISWVVLLFVCSGKVDRMIIQVKVNEIVFYYLDFKFANDNQMHHQYCNLKLNLVNMNKIYIQVIYHVFDCGCLSFQYILLLLLLLIIVTKKLQALKILTIVYKLYIQVLYNLYIQFVDDRKCFFVHRKILIRNYLNRTFSYKFYFEILFVLKLVAINW